MENPNPSKGKNPPSKSQPSNPSNVSSTGQPSKGTNKPQPALPPATPPAPKQSVPPRPAPLFRRIDWVTFVVTALLVFIGYCLTLAPDLTLEDSGELAVGSFYAGVPHPPGYPVWAIYTWLFSQLVPIANIAYRVALASAFAGAVASGMLAFMVSRGSSMLMEGIADLKNIDRRWENFICMVSGFASGMLLGFNGFMWSQAVIVEVYPFSVVSLMGVILCLLRWIYAPHQRRYLYWAMFLFGICFTNHQTLITAAVGIEVAIAATQPKLGRDLFLGNGAIYLLGLVARAIGVGTPLDTNASLVPIYHAIGMGSMIMCGWLWIKKPKTSLEVARDACFYATLFSLLIAAGRHSPAFVLLATVAFAAFIKLAYDTWKLGREWLAVIICGFLWLVGAAFYFYMPLAGMTNPPMQWGYPRTVEGFFHALSRGQYERANPTDVLHDPGRFFMQLGMLFEGVVDEFNWVFAFIALVPCFFFHRMQKREKAWLIGIWAIYLCLGVLLLILLNPPPDRQARELIRVFFTASHVMIAILVGYGLTLIAASMATHYDRFRRWGLYGGAVAAAFALFSLAMTTQTMLGEQPGMGSVSLFFHALSTSFAKDQYGLPVYAGLLLLGMTLIFVLAMSLSRSRPQLGITLVLFAVMPAHSVMTHWFDNEQRGHLFGYWFGHDMFTPPYGLYPEMDRDTVLYGGTDPGRFCPTYMIFCESFIPPEKKKDTDPKFDRRDVYIITQNALADATYLMYIRAHYNRSTQIDPPFFQELLRPQKEREQNYRTNFIARLAGRLLDGPFEALGDHIEKVRRAGSSYFKEADFKDLAGFVDKLRPGDQQDPLSKYLYANLSRPTQELLATPGDEPRLRRALAQDLNRLLERELVNRSRLRGLRGEAEALEQELAGSGASAKKKLKKEQVDREIADLEKVGPLYDPERFKGVDLAQTTRLFVAQNPQSHTRIRLNRLLLEEAYPQLIAKSKGGVYPDREIHTATPAELQQCFTEYMEDAQRRMRMNPPQLKLGEDVKFINDRLQVSGQVAVMAINGLVTKVIFDRNPGHEFYIEESFALDWMYPHLTPYGIIMKINRQPLLELTDDIIRKDHEFWTRYSERLVGNWVTYETSVKEIVDFVERVYLRHDFSGYKGDRKFVRDDQAQKAFSKLRSSIGGVYAWRVVETARKLMEIQSKPPAERQALEAEAQRLGVEQQRMFKEADFAFRQAFAFCPYSPEAVFRYAQLLINMQHTDDALLVAETCQKLDPYNGGVRDLVRNLRDAKRRQPAISQVQASFAQLEKDYREQPTNFQAAFNLAAACLQTQQTNRAVEILDKVLNHSNVEASAILAIAQAYAQMANFPKLESVLEKLVQVSPDSPEAVYDLAAIKSAVGKTAECLSALGRALKLSAERRARDPAAHDLRGTLAGDNRFDALRALPEFQALAATNK